MTAPETHRPTSDLLSELRQAVKDLPRLRLHVHPDSAMWIAISVQNTGMSPYVQVVPDVDCPELGRGWVETLTVDQWREMRSLVGQLATVTDHRLGALTGTLLSLDHDEAKLDLGADDVRFLRWVAIAPASGQ